MSVELERVTPETLEQYASRLGAVLAAQVDAGTSMNFLHPFTAEETTRMFRNVVPAVTQGYGPGGVIMWVARLSDVTDLESIDKDGKRTDHGDIIGTVQLAFHMANNGRFRCEVRRLLVDPRASRRGVARTLMDELEKTAKEHGSTLMLLDTETESAGEKLYRSLGWQVIGICPNYAYSPDGQQKASATFMYKEI